MTATAAFIAAWFVYHGVPHPQTNALLHYIATESGFDACAESGSGHYLMQWVAERRWQLQRFAGTRGCPPLQKQLEYTLAELRQPSFRCFFGSTNPYATLRRTFGAGGRC